ncbi:cell division cycle-associated 7-like protein isoform X3 [Jatropha curcas]|uniref:cell division cycle-associated 7-like protein isoform X3 n=1 Tax=Jatropha curcas TaxID=180498 RepID=UPI0009D776AC|nr:cell division cycle-associated 7-like protein isoform X3 [Jatropha curcas]
MGRLKNRIEYENIRNARILENKARLASLGLEKTISDLRSLTSSVRAEKSKTQRKKWTKRVYDTTNLRRSNRLKDISTTVQSSTSNNVHRLRRSNRLLRTNSTEPISLIEEEENRPANAPLVKGAEVLCLSPEASARRCNSKGRGSIYDPVFGICCHFCRQKKLCGEEDCKRCGNLDPDQPCIGKTDCSICHSSNGVFCRGCLKVRYGEEMEEVRENKKWVCPHCIEEKGINPFWICNSSLCLKKRKMAPTGLAIYKEKWDTNQLHIC